MGWDAKYGMPDRAGAHAPLSLHRRYITAASRGAHAPLPRGSYGRLDLPGSSVDAMYDSTRKLAKLDSALPMFPGHAYSGEP